MSSPGTCKRLSRDAEKPPASVACDLLFTVAPESLPQLQPDIAAPPLVVVVACGSAPVQLRASLLNRAETRFGIPAKALAVTARRKQKKGLTFEDVCALASALPGVVRSTSYGTPSLKVRTKMLVRMKEDGESMVMRVSFVVRDHLLATAPDSFYITDHYRDYPAVLARLGVADPAVIEQLLEDAWRAAAPKRLIEEYDAP